MTLETWSVFVAVYIVVCLTPGPAVFFVTSQSAWRGPKSGFAAALGIESANVIYWTLSALGLAAVIAASQTVFMTLKWIGVAYLVYLGVKAIAGSLRPGDKAQSQASAQFAYRDGFVVGLSNPKAMLFFVALLPQFLQVSEPLARQVAILAVTGVFTELTIFGAYALAAGQLGKALDRPGVKRWSERLVGGTFLSLAAVTALFRRGH